MDIFKLFSNNRDSREMERTRNIIILYVLNKDIYKQNDIKYSLKEDEEIKIFFEKYQDFTNLDEINIDDFPIEKLFVHSIDIYEKLKSGEYELDLDGIPFISNNEEMMDRVSESLTNTYIDIFEKELESLEDIQDKELKDYKNNYQFVILNELMNKYVETEEYEKAAEIRDKINELK